MPGRRFLPFCFRPRRLAAMAVLSVAIGACAFAQEEPAQEPQQVGDSPKASLKRPIRRLLPRCRTLPAAWFAGW